jgi:hypothetical protein
MISMYDGHLSLLSIGLSVNGSGAGSATVGACLMTGAWWAHPVSMTTISMRLIDLLRVVCCGALGFARFVNGNVSALASRLQHAKTVPTLFKQKPKRDHSLLGYTYNPSLST